MEFEPTFWHWWIAAAVLIILEILAPTFYLLWTGIAALLVGLLVWLIPSIIWEVQFIVFAVLAVTSIIIWRNYYQNHPIATDEPVLNRRGEHYIGRVITLQEPIINGIGKINIDDSTWKIQGEDCPAGTKVKIIASENVLFQVSIVD